MCILGLVKFGKSEMGGYFWVCIRVGISKFTSQLVCEKKRGKSLYEGSTLFNFSICFLNFHHFFKFSRIFTILSILHNFFSIFPLFSIFTIQNCSRGILSLFLSTFVDYCKSNFRLYFWNFEKLILYWFSLDFRRSRFFGNCN